MPQLTLQDLVNLIKSMSLRIFHSEAQFQFSLAWEIKKHFQCDILLEEYHQVGNLKMYTDIIVKFDDFKIAIELKYKTKDYSDGNVKLCNHGARDLGLYDYLYDVSRIEKLVKNGIVDKGFAVLLTNDNGYWTVNHSACPYIYKEFCIGENDGKLFGKTMDWRPNNPYPATAGKQRATPIKLNRPYTYKWYDYLNNNQKNGNFRYTIIEIN